MSFDWAAAKAQLASAVTETFGESVTITFVTPGTYNPATGTESSDTTVSVTCNAVLSADRDADIQGAAMASKVRNVVFVVADADLSGNVPDNRTTVTKGSEVRQVVRAEREIGRAAWRLTCRDRQTRA